MLGLALGRAVGRPFAHYTHDRIITELSMTHTAFELTPAMREHIARGYSRRSDGKVGRSSRTGVIVLWNSDLVAAGVAVRALEKIAAAATKLSTEAAAGR